MRRFFRAAARAALFAAFFAVSCRVDGVFAQDSELNVNRELVDDSVKFEKTFDVSTGSFTVAIRAKMIEPGGEIGNGDGNAMLWNVANGWNHGMRVVYTWKTGQYSFQIGTGDVRCGANTRAHYFPGIMRDVVATYDGTSRRASLYVDGELAGIGEFKGELTTENSRLNVGFGGSGVGSARMYVDKAETWTRALSATEVAERQKTRPQEELVAVEILKKLDATSRLAPSVDADPASLRAALALDLPSEAKAVLRENLAARLAADVRAVDRDLNVGVYEEFATLVLSAAKAACEGGEADAAGNDAGTEPSPDALSAYGTLKERLELLRRVSQENAKRALQYGDASSFNEETRRQYRAKARALRETSQANAASADSLLKRLDERFAAESEVFKKIGKLESSAARVRRIERDALGLYYEVVSSARGEKYAREIFVAPDGSDETGDGTSASPYATLSRAFQVAEEYSKSEENKGKGTTIRLATGEYFVEKPSVLRNASKIFIQGAQDGATKLTGSRRIANFQTLSDASRTDASVASASERFAPEVRDKIFTADLRAAGVKDLGTLKNRGYGSQRWDSVNPIPTFSLNGEAQTLARWPNDGEPTLKFGEKSENPSGIGDNATTFRYDYDRVDGWKLDGANDDVWAFGLFQWEWAANLRRVLKIDRENKTIAFDYKDGSGRFDYYFVNVLEELDAPGEYYVDRASGRLYFYPPEGITTASALNGADAEYDEYEGRFIELEGVSDLVVSNVTISGGRDTAVSMKDCARCYFADSTIEQMGGNGVVVVGGESCGVVNARLRSLGGAGVGMRGGDLDELKPCRHLVHNSYISDFSRIDRVYAPAVIAEGCGLVVTNNLFCDSPHHAMRTDGRDIYVARNEVHSVVYEYSDQSGIDIYCDPNYRGIVIERNLWRHIGSAFALCGQAGIRLDDSISGVVMKENVFYRSSGGRFGGIQIHGGKDNLVVDNAFVDCLQAVSFSPWGAGRYEKFVKEGFSKYVDSDLYKQTYPFFDEIFEHDNRNYVLDNQAINCGKFNVSGDGQDVFVGNTSRVETPDLKKLGVKGADADRDPAELFYSDEKTLKKWLEEISGISLKDVGLKANWKGAGEPVSPRFIKGGGAEK